MESGQSNRGCLPKRRRAGNNLSLNAAMTALCVGVSARYNGDWLSNSSLP